MPSSAQLLLCPKTSGGASDSVARSALHMRSDSEAEQLVQRATSLTMLSSAQLLQCSKASGGVSDSISRSALHLWWLVNLCTSLALCRSTLQCGSCWHTRSNSEAVQLAQRSATLAMPSSAQQFVRRCRCCCPLSHARLAARHCERRHCRTACAARRWTLHTFLNQNGYGSYNISTSNATA